MSWVILQCLVSFLMHVIPRRTFRRFTDEDVEGSEEKLFEHYLVLPPELRIMIIDQMKTKDRCRFTRCSKTCNKEAKSSKNYYYSLSFCGYNKDDIVIFIRYSKKGNSLMIQFKKEEKEIFDMWSTTTKFVTFNDSQVDKEVWRKNLSKSTDLVEYAAGYFKKLLKEHQKNIKYFGVKGALFWSTLKDYDFGIENFNHLEILSIEGSMNVPLYLSKLRRPLERLFVKGQGDSNMLTQCEQICQIRDYVSAPKMKLTNEQFSRLSAQQVHIDIGDLTEHDIFGFIRSWQNGKEVSIYEWTNIRESNFNIRKLFRLLGREEYYRAGRGSIEIKRNKEIGNIAKLSYAEGLNLKFEVNRRN